MPSEFNFNAHSTTVPTSGYIYNAIARYEVESSAYINSFGILDPQMTKICYEESRILKKIIHDAIYKLYSSCNCICCETSANAICDIGLSVLNQFKDVSTVLYPANNDSYQKYLHDILIHDSEKTIQKIIDVFCQCRKKIVPKKCKCWASTICPCY